MDKWVPNLADEMKYELFIPLCTTAMTTGWDTSAGYKNLMHHAFEKFTIDEYNC